MQITILYFAQLAELAGKTEEQRHVDSSSVEQLYHSLKEDYTFPHSFDAIQVAINHELTPEGRPLQDGDTLTFLPPMTGG
ncbi:molybdopterin converting factor subunit 1 [Coraliomargarita akajimensis]|uniref:Molybdopterin synthase sulfur carrier subunit n=1 Tax=Coraliomargarita akajimensis (strain DSM 45221 / IAM 15411 / JCM 23193 / KCTC 12865 / 04OKA010-24) TaxID=583355 RepID=D5EMF1_CORAD|nr:molybdopterin converting factor subunit 1 [Coraliomargarita akajimensis]ADE53357.1 thiamineS protein [Coraliomargarita akajimensis DSM 45221]